MPNQAFDWHKHYHGRALTSYASLEADERGVAYTLLDLIYDNQGPIVRNDRLLGARNNMGPTKFRRILEKLIALGKFHETDDGCISNKTSEIELDSVRNLSEIRKKAGKKGGKKSAKPGKKDNENSETGKQKLKQNESKSLSRDIRGGESKPFIGLRLPLFKREADEDDMRAIEALCLSPGLEPHKTFILESLVDYADGVFYVSGEYARLRLDNNTPKGVQIKVATKEKTT